MNRANERLLRRAYEAFNVRDVDGVLALMHPDVDWPNGMAGGRLHGHREVRDYWRAQFDSIDSRVDPRRFEQHSDGQVIVTVDQVIRDRAGHVIFEGAVEHRYVIDGALIRRMDIAS